MQVNTGLVKVLHILEHAAALLAQLHDVAHIVGGRIDVRFHHRLIGLLYLRRIGVVRGVVYIHGLAARLVYLVNNGRRCCDKIKIILAFKALLYDLHVQKSEKSAAETESQRHGSLRLKCQRRVIQPELLQRITQIAVL